MGSGGGGEKKIYLSILKRSIRHLHTTIFLENKVPPRIQNKVLTSNSCNKYFESFYCLAWRLFFYPEKNNVASYSIFLMSYVLVVYSMVVCISFRFA